MKNDGGQAFPSIIPKIYKTGFPGDAIDYVGGMSLRDWYKGQALIGAVAESYRNGNEFGWATPESVAKKCGEYADAMLKEREKP